MCSYLAAVIIVFENWFYKHSWTEGARPLLKVERTKEAQVNYNRRSVQRSLITVRCHQIVLQEGWCSEFQQRGLVDSCSIYLTDYHRVGIGLYTGIHRPESRPKVLSATPNLVESKFG